MSLGVVNIRLLHLIWGFGGHLHRTYRARASTLVDSSKVCYILGSGGWCSATEGPGLVTECALLTSKSFELPLCSCCLA